jgi:D-arabinono-1,4-lactone oxidase
VAGAGPDGFHHPASEAELVDLVKAAYREGRRLRVRGAAHSISDAIYTASTEPNRVSRQTPPPGDDVNVMLDRYRAWRVVDEQRKLVEADAGIHLGADPSDPTATATLESSLLYQLATERRWTLYDTGGITHQTVSGFTATGSSGGSLQYTSNRNLHGFRVIDGRGEIHEVSCDDADQDGFNAMSPSLGLLGVISKITFECTDLFAIDGHEFVTTVEGGPVDLFGEGANGRLSLEQYLRHTDFARLEWWPQRGADRLLTWQATRMPVPPDFKPRPYKRFEGGPEESEQMIAILFTILGNLDDLSKAKGKLEDNFDRLETVLRALPPARRLGAAGRIFAKFLSHTIEFGVDAGITMLEPFAWLLADTVPDFYPRLLEAFIPLDKGEPQHFQDYGWSGLPMDNQADDELLPTEFTEAWVPMPRTRDVINLLNAYFTEPRDEDDAYKRTGTYAWELYSAMPSPFWLSPAHSDGADEWKDGALRIDPYWFADNAANPAETLFAGLWRLLRENGVPFRLHWGKFQPIYARGDRDWVDFFRSQYPRWDDFLALRAERDPNNIFLTDYWRDRFGLWDEPEPRPMPEAEASGAPPVPA